MRRAVHCASLCNCHYALRVDDNERLDVRQRLSRFCILITLASIIAAAGVAADSTAIVIGTMIVALLITPILGTALDQRVSDDDQIHLPHARGLLAW